MSKESVYDKKQMKGYEDSFVVEGKMALPYTYFAGRVGSSSSQLSGIRRKYGSKMPYLQRSLSAAAAVCDKDFTDIRDQMGRGKHTGMLANFTVVRYDRQTPAAESAFVLALIKLDGADTPFMHILEECEIEDVKIGMKVELYSPKKRRIPSSI